MAGARPTMRETGERLAAVVRGGGSELPLLRLLLELLARAGRDPDLRGLARGFWSGTRALSAQAIGDAYEESGTKPPAAPEALATAMIALDIGLALQHYVDPDAVPLEYYPELYETVFGPAGTSLAQVK